MPAGEEHFSPIRALLLFALLLALAPCSLAGKRTVLDLQPHLSTQSLSIRLDGRSGHARLSNLNDNFNIWYVLEVTWPGEQKYSAFHLENPDPARFSYALDKSYMNGLLVFEGSEVHRCELWGNQRSDLRESADISKTFVPICDDRILVRNALPGQETRQEFVAGFLRKYVWGGEEITGFVKDYLYRDKFLLTSDVTQAEQETSAQQQASVDVSPAAASLDPRFRGALINADELGIALEDADRETMRVGQWVATRASEDIFVSVIQPRMIDPSVLNSHRQQVKSLDAIEKSAMVYLSAFKLSAFDIGFALGTLHPSPGWSQRAAGKVDTRGQPGPDGFSSYYPMVMVGKVNPFKAPRVAATFAGGFKRSHGAFKWGRLSEINQASHYGFRVNGVTFSTLQPELATILVGSDGRVEMKTWSQADDAEIAGILHARQNGVPLIEWDPQSGQGVPGQYVSDWGLGNWSGSAQSHQRTLRSGACIQEHNGERFLIYGYFSSVTANAMARVFQAYQCRYAIHLDMNGLEHTYIAVYEKADQSFSTQHLLEGMHVLDKKEKGSGTIVPRFIGTADNRDFFYVMRKNQD